MNKEWWKEHWFGLLTIAAMVVGSALVAVMLLPHTPPRYQDPSVLETLFDSRAAILGVRLVLYNAAVFLVASILARVWAGQWVFKMGPVETDKDVAAQKSALTELDRWKQRAARAEARIEELDRSLADTEANYKRVVAELVEAERRAQSTAGDDEGAGEP